MVARLSALLLTALLVSVPMVPAEHVHEIEDHGHTELIVHRHLQAHVVHRDTNRTVDHQDAPVASLDQDYTVPALASAAAPAVTGSLILIPPAPRAHAGFAAFNAPLIHGPPRAPASLRAPPSPSRR